MKSFAALLGFIAVAMISWGVYGPVLNNGKEGMHGSALRPFICVGLAYFAIAVVAPIVLLRLTKEVGRWSTTGVVWSLAAGAAGAVGALGVILALAFRGNPLFVMPLIFGGAPVVNTFLTMYWGKSFRQVNPLFLAGLIVVITGAVTVLVFRPHGHGSAAETIKETASKDGKLEFVVIKTDGSDPQHYEADSLEQLAKEHPDVYKLRMRTAKLTAREFMYVVLFTAMTALCWGVYGPTLHRGQMNMAGSRLRPFICVGMAYFLIAVIVPILLLTQWQEPGEFTFGGTMWSLAGGTAGALGALGIIMAFNFGGKPIFVMPLVFGGAPVINTFVSLIHTGNWDLNAWFYAGLLLVAAGAVTVLIFAPKTGKHAPEPDNNPKPEAAAA